MIFEPLDFIASLAALVPKPIVKLARFHSVFAASFTDFEGPIYGTFEPLSMILYYSIIITNIGIDSSQYDVLLFKTKLWQPKFGAFRAI